MKEKIPPQPREESDTARRRIVAVLSDGPSSGRELSTRVRIPERDVYDHLLHIRRSLREEGARLVITPSSCRGCGFVFRKRDRPGKPGRCPVCRGTSIEEPLFSIVRP